MTFDPSITLGAMLNAVVLLIGFVVAFTRIGGRIDLLSVRMGAVEEAIKLARSNDSRLATIEERLTNHSAMLTTVQRDVSDLRHGAGWITSHRTSIDGEYK
jgi:hypothetical protein